MLALRLAIFSLCLALTGLQAQLNTADIIGTVTDASGAVLAGVSITAENLETKATRQTQSDGTGNYLVPLLPIGRYTVRAESKGFRTWNVAAGSGTWVPSSPLVPR